MSGRTTLLLTASLLLLAAPLAADGPAVLEEVRVTATRLPTDVLDLPFAAARVDGEAVQRGRQQLGLDEALAGQPGLFFHLQDQSKPGC